MKTRKTRIIALAVLILLQSALLVFFGFRKSYLHMDEAYSFGLSSYHRVEIQENEDFYNHWHTNDYYEDYLSLQEDELGDFKPVYDNQKNDVHPPFYYLLLRLAMFLSVGHFSVWPGLIINIIVCALTTVFSYLIMLRVFNGHKNREYKAMILAVLSSLTDAALTTALYVRMYSLSALNILIIAYLHIRLKEEPDKKAKWFAFIGTAALIGSLTHYYYLFYLFALFVHQAYRYLRSAEFKALGGYVLTMVLAGGASLAIFPYSIQHMFFGYRGEGFIDKLKDIPQFLINIASYAWTTNQYIFNFFLIVIAIFSVFVLAYRKNNRHKVRETVMPDEETKDVLKSLYAPTTFYFAIVAAASPFIELRYIAPIGGLIFLLVFYYFQRLLSSVFGESRGNFLVGTALILMFVAVPAYLKLEPETTYHDNAAIVDAVENDYNLPAVYVINSQHNRFLDDILLFSKLDESYIALDTELSAENYKSILEGKDVSNGVVVVIGELNDNDAIIQAFKEATGHDHVQWLKGLNAANVYYFGPER